MPPKCCAAQPNPSLIHSQPEFEWDFDEHKFGVMPPRAQSRETKRSKADLNIRTPVGIVTSDALRFVRDFGVILFLAHEPSTPRLSAEC